MHVLFQTLTTMSSGPPHPGAAWQECEDSTTGYPYYWNTVTNEVRWECPPDNDDNDKDDVVIMMMIMMMMIMMVMMMMMIQLSSTRCLHGNSLNHPLTTLDPILW